MWGAKRPEHITQWTKDERVSLASVAPRGPPGFNWTRLTTDSLRQLDGRIASDTSPLSFEVIMVYPCHRSVMNTLRKLGSIIR